MKSFKTPNLIIVVLLFVFASTGVLVLNAQENNDVMHPKISLLDKDGNVVVDKNGAVDSERTCGQCHDSNYINNHNNHFNSVIKADCISCHLKDSQLGDNYNTVNLRIQLPDNSNCANCHGLIETGTQPFFIPEDYEHSLEHHTGKKYYDITAHTGVIMGSKDLANSAINIKNKKELHFPWDVHMRRELTCISCHVIGNDPRYCGKIFASLDHLLMDPRKIKSPGEILKRPDHNLRVAACTCCHDPFRVHKDLPYKKRHMEALSCQACHVPGVYGPAIQTIDATVVKADGSPRVEYRGVDEKNSHGTAMSTKYFEGYKPFLLPHVYRPVNRKGNESIEEIEKAQQHPVYKISPFNLVTYWKWKSAVTGTQVPDDIIKEVFLDESTPSHYATDILSAFDKNNDQTLEPEELVLDNTTKIELIKGKLIQLGIQNPVIEGKIQAYQINHGVIEGMHMKRDCAACHAPKSKLGKEVMLATFAPSGIIPEFSSDIEPIIEGDVAINHNGSVILKQTGGLSGRYVFGHSRIKLIDQVGLWIFILVILGIMMHGSLRYVFSLKRPHHQPKTKKVYMYRFYERLWHWTMAGGVTLLALTGIEIHYSGSFVLFGLEYAVAIHNVLAFILVINAVLSLFYHLTTGEIKKFFGFNKKFLHETIVQAYYYIYGIFKGDPHPINKTLERRLNPLQQLTYIGLLNILLPFQVITGILIWGAEKWPFLSETLRGLTFLAPIHNFGSWLFLAFLAAHIYLTTTGHTVFSNIRAMITGYDDVSEEEALKEQQELMEMKLMDMVGTIIGKIVKKDKPSISGGR